MGRVVITIDEIIAGKGLRSNKATKPPSLEVYCGKGLEIGDNYDVALKVANGLKFNSEGQLEVNNNEVAGAGLVPGPGSSVEVDLAVDENNSQQFEVLSDSSFETNCGSLVFKKTFVTYVVDRNAAGVVLSIRATERRTELEPLNIDGYGYGNAPPVQVKAKPNQPSFYKTCG